MQPMRVRVEDEEVTTDPLPEPVTGRSDQEPPIAPAIFIGVQKGFGAIQDFRCYNLTAPVGPHPIGSTLSEHTLVAMGFTLPDAVQVKRYNLRQTFNPWGAP